MIKLPNKACLVLAAFAAAGAVACASASGASAGTTIAFTIANTGNNGTAYLTKAGLSYVYPGRQTTGDEIFNNDTLVNGTKKIGFGNEVCTVTFDGYDFCRTIAVFPGKGDLDATWLWVGRNKSKFGPRRFAGVIDGGTGAYANATGQFEATVNHDGTVNYTATLS